MLDSRASTKTVKTLLSTFFVCAFICAPLSWLPVADTSQIHPHSRLPAVMLWLVLVAFLVSLAAAAAGMFLPVTTATSRLRAVLLVLAALAFLTPTVNAWIASRVTGP